MERRRSDKELVRAHKVAPVISADSGGNTRGSASVEELRGSRLLNGADSIKAALALEAQSRGFDAFGIAKPDTAPHLRKRLQDFLDADRHGDMAWLASSPERRASPLVMWPQVRSIVMLGMNYGPDEDPLAALERRDCGAISVYGRGDDYHDLIKSRLKDLAQWLVQNAGGDVKVFVDTAAVMEKPLANHAGLGWQGKHTNLVSRRYGSWLFLGSIFTTLDLPADSPEADICGSCRACLDVCPTAAFPAPYTLDARRCISYLTIEHKGHIPRDLRGAIGNRIFGCDDCLAVCPWNKFASEGREVRLAARDSLRAPPLAELVRLDDAEFRKLFSKSPIKRTGRARFVRNVLIAIGNSGNPALAGEAERLLDDTSPLVRGAAVWALSKLLPRKRLSELRERQYESDISVQEEWAAALRTP